MLSESCQTDVVIRAGDTSEAAPGIDRQIRQAQRMLGAEEELMDGIVEGGPTA